MILLDTGGLWAALDRSQPRHADCREALDAAPKPWLLSPFVLQELDHFLRKRLGEAVELALLEEVARGVYQLESFDALDLMAAHAIATRHQGLGVGLADASLVVLAERHKCLDVLTVDHRHLGVLLADGRPFRMHPGHRGA